MVQSPAGPGGEQTGVTAGRLVSSVFTHGSVRLLATRRQSLRIWRYREVLPPRPLLWPQHGSLLRATWRWLFKDEAEVAVCLLSHSRRKGRESKVQKPNSILSHSHVVLPKRTATRSCQLGRTFQECCKEHRRSLGRP